MDSSGQSSTFGLVLATLLLNYGLNRFKFDWLERRVSRDMWQFVAGTCVFVIVWLIMGFLGLLPVLGSVIGWKWIPIALQQLIGNPLLTVAGITVAGTLVTIAGVTAYTPLLKLFAIRPALNRKSVRWLSALSSVYVGLFSLDLMRVIFATDNDASSFSMGTAMSYVVVIAALWTVGRYLTLKKRASPTVDQMMQLGILLTVGTIVGDTLTKGSLHLAQVNYATFARALGATWPGMIMALAVVAFAVVVFRRIGETTPDATFNRLRDVETTSSRRAPRTNW